MPTRLVTAIALATWNGEPFLERQLQSYLEQTRLPDQLVVSDDCSRDRTLQIVQQFASRAPFPVRIISNPVRAGYAQNFARAMDACEADVILLSDQDDIWLPRHVEALVEPFEKSPQVLLTLSRSRHFTVDGNGKSKEWDIANSFIRRWSWRRCRRDGLIAGFVQHREPPFAGHGTGFRCTLRPFILPVASDWHDFWIDSVASALGEFVFVDEVLTMHRVHERNTAGYGHKKNLRLSAAPTGCAKEIARLQQFVHRLENVAPSRERAIRSLQLARRAIRTLELRSRAQQIGPRGISICVRMLLRGDYHACALGLFTFGRDMFTMIKSPRALQRKKT